MAQNLACKERRTPVVKGIHMYYVGFNFQYIVFRKEVKDPPGRGYEFAQPHLHLLAEYIQGKTILNAPVSH